MRVYDIIYRKREGFELSKEEIDYLIKGYTTGDIPDYQLSAWTMAVYFNGMTTRETADLTMAMVNSGDRLDLGEIPGIKVDKHSTGGVGDTTTLVLAPLVSAAGIPVAKLSGRGLGHTGGTIDKLESIPGFQTSLSIADFMNNVREIGIAVAGQTANLTPADKKLYALRDVTATVDSIPLIASSIMSKKIAGGANGIVLDVKTGDGAFMKELAESRQLARAMVDIGKELGRTTIAVITDMSQPLGFAVGNTLEVIEAINTLKGQGPSDLRELCLTLGANMLLIAGRTKEFDEAYQLLSGILDSGKALEQLKRLISYQSGDPQVIDNYNKFPSAAQKIKIKSESKGYVTGIAAREIGLAARAVGAGRKDKDDEIDPAVGIILKKKIGDMVEKNDVLAALHVNGQAITDEIIDRIKKAFTINNINPESKKLIHEIIN